ncbi:Lrp/AsnC family transcriptional regulator [Actinomadura rubrisoli]|uniref:AsnC family transcriptional regulator n=1 Tax=Actinomadura rubrisoli TaxID=2530368 RepID=A0A4R5BP27_9ACTN|nr:AsnC family transcriptional regulator [Actinomadura rubrisoli]TDD87123.1 AsnC family transcriptional regulator [Actinomadura rubrisoli]
MPRLSTTRPGTKPPSALPGRRSDDAIARPGRAPARPERVASVLDDVDRGIIHALRIDGRAPFSRIASVLGVSTQTVARRYGRLSSEASLRVVGLADSQRAGQAQWMVRLTASPHAAQDLAHGLARRPDTSWVRLTSGGTEIFSIINTLNDSVGHHSLLLRDIPRTASITAVSAHRLLHTYLGGPTAWHGHAAALTEEQQHRLRCRLASSNGISLHSNRAALADTDRHLLAALQRNGRASHGDLAAATGWSSSTVARRLAVLQASGAIFFDVEINDQVLGITTQALLWASVAPAHLDEVARTLAQHEELAFVAATTGPTNLVALILCRDPSALHHYLTHRLGALDAIRTLETAPVLKTLKASSPVPVAEPARRLSTAMAAHSR